MHLSPAHCNDYQLRLRARDRTIPEVDRRGALHELSRRDRHAIFAYLSTGVKVRVSPAMSYDSACRLFYDDRHDLAAGGVANRETVFVGDFEGHVRHFAVRSMADPNWPSEQPPHDVTVVA